MNTNDILNALTSGEVSEEQILSVIKENRRRNQTAKLYAAQSMKIGQRCSVSGISPKRLNGTVGTIASFNSSHTRADIKVESGGDPFRYPKGSILSGIPLVCLNGKE